MTDDRGPDSAVDVGGPALESEHARRSVLRGALALGAVGIGGALTGCGGGSSSTASSTTGQASAPVSGANATATPAPAATAAPAASTAPAPAAGGGTSLGPASKVPVGGGVIYEVAKVVVTQPTAGQYKAFGAICTHQTCLLADVSGGTINCACHGSKFSITDGEALKPPAVDPLPAKKVTVSGGKVFVT